MAAALLRRGSGLCVRCIHRELCRVVWRPQTALFTTKPSDRKQPRRTHIKKAKPQPAVDVATLLEQLFSQSRRGTAPPAGKAPPAKASSTPTKPPSTFSVKVSTSHAPPLSKTEPAVSAFPAASSFKQVDADSVSNVTVPTTPAPAAPLRSEAAETECQTSAETVETKVETAQKLSTATELPLSAHMVERNIETLSVPAAPVEPFIETTIESPVEPVLSPVETLQVRAAVLDAPAEDVQTSSTDSGVVNVSHTAKEELLTETIESPVEASHFPVETLETAAAVGGPAEPTIDVAVDVAAEKVETDSGVIDIPHTATVEPTLEMTVEPSVEAGASPLETRESRAAVAECAVEPTVDATVDAQAVQTSSTDSGVVNISYGAKEEALVEATIEPAVEASSCLVSEGTVESEAAVSLSHTALIQNAQESAPFPLNNERTVESGSVNVAVEEEGMTLESVTLHADKLLVASLQTDELLQTKSALDDKAEKQLQELLVQTEIERKAETESSSEDEGEILTDVLSTWDSLSEDLQELEGESGALVAELLCNVPAALSKTASDPPVGANGEQTEEEAGEAEAMTLESITLAKVKAEFGGLETEVLLEARDALEKEADALAKEEKMEVTPTAEDVAVSEDTTEAEILTLDSISEATDALEAETSVILEAMFGSEQGPRQPLADQKLERQIEATGVEAEKEPEEQEGSVLEAMSLESVTLAEVEASLGALENECLSDIADYLEKEAEIVAGERRVEGDADAVASEETTEALKMESLPEADALSEDLQIDALMEELLLTGFTEGSIGQEVVRADILDATVATGSVDVDTAAPVTDDLPASPALKEVLQGQEEEEEEEEGAQTDALGIRDDLDPVQRLFLEKIKEYNNTRRLNGLLEAEPDYEKYLSEETAKLQRLYGGGDLSSFPQFTFTEPDMDQDSK